MHCAHALGNAIVGDFTYTGDSATERMYLDAHRIVVPNNLEDLDVERPGQRPFADVPEYKDSAVVRTLSEAYQVLENRSAAANEWKLVSKPL